MSSTSVYKSKKDSKKKRLLTNIPSSSGSEDENGNHELSYYKNDKIRMMKEVLKILKPKKIKSMAPDCIKNLDIEEINAMLLEELLGISNKRLGYIFNGENADRESSSSESEDEKPVEVISLDDISDDDIEICIGHTENNLEDSEMDKKRKRCKTKTTIRSKEPSIKSEKSDKSKKKKKSTKSESNGNEKDKLMSVLELLELQARARAIRSQLALEAAKKKPEPSIKLEEISDDDEVIIESPAKDEIVIDSSDSEGEKIKKVNPLEIEIVSDNNVAEKSENSNCFATHLESMKSINPASVQQKDNKNEGNDIENDRLDDEINNKKCQKKFKQKVKIIRDWTLQSDGLIIDNKEKENTQLNQNNRGDILFSLSTSQYGGLAGTEKKNEISTVKLSSTDEKSYKCSNIEGKEAHLKHENIKTEDKNGKSYAIKHTRNNKRSHNDCENDYIDEIIINVDEDEMNEMEGS